MAGQLGVCEVTLTSQMRRRGYRRNVPANRLPRAARPRPRQPGLSDLLRFDFDPADPAASLKSVMDQARRAADEGRIGHFRELMRSALLLWRVLRDVARPWPAEASPPAGPPPPAPMPAPPPDPPPPASPPVPSLTLRPAQTPPKGSWSTWLFMGGRGAGKTLAGSAWLAGAADRVGRLALVGATLHDVREVMIGGPSGLMALPRWIGGERPVYEPSRRRLRFPNGAEAWVFSAEDPDSLRGPQFEAAWADEFCAWARPEETLAMLRLGLRLGADPRLVITTTPRPMAALRALKAEAACVATHAPTRDNAAHLAPGFLDGLTALYGGTRREAQEMEGLIVEVEGGLFRAEDLARARDGERPVRFDRIVVAVDPSTTAGGDACGIVAAGRAGDVAYVLADRSMRGLSPDAWARRAIATLDAVGPGVIVAEVNQGGEMVVQTLRTARPDVRVRQVRATQGKRLRAEPVAALYEQGRVRHLGRFRELEEELMAVGGPDDGRLSLDRADALVWAVTDLMLTPRGQGPSFRVLCGAWGRTGWSALQPKQATCGSPSVVSLR